VSASRDDGRFVRLLADEAREGDILAIVVVFFFLLFARLGPVGAGDDGAADLFALGHGFPFFV